MVLVPSPAPMSTRVSGPLPVACRMPAPTAFQIVLYEGIGHFEIRHKACTSDGTTHATGFEDADGSIGLSIRHGLYSTTNKAWRVTAPGGATGGPDSFGYRWVSTGYSFEDIKNTRRISIGDDAMSTALPIGFNFIYYRRQYTQVYASSNGFLSFLSGQSHGCCVGRRTPTVGTPEAVIAPFWEDLSPPTAGSMWYSTRGSSPNRRFILQWEGVAHFGGGNLVEHAH